MELKKTVKYDGKIKAVHIVDGNIVDSDGVVINLVSILEKAYGENLFDISTTTKTEEIIDIDEEVDIEDLEPEFEEQYIIT